MFPSEYNNLDNSQLALKSLFENTHHAVFFLDLEGKHLAANDQALAFFGYSLEELQQLSVKQTSTEMEKSQEVLERLKAGENIPLYERTFKKKDGTLVFGEVSVVLVRDTLGKPLIIQSIIRDITKRKHIEHTLKETKEYLETLFQILPVGVSIADSVGKIILTNSTALTILGYDSFSSLPISIMDPTWKILSSDGSVLNSEAFPGVRVLNERAKIEGVELGIERKDGTIAWVIVNAAPIPEGGVVMSYVDISEMRTIKETLLNAKKAAEDATKTKSQFLANMSHEIRTPLNSMLGFTELLEQTPLQENQLQFLQYARMSGKNLLDIINDILDYSKIEAGMLELHPEFLDLGEIVQQLIQQLAPQAQNKKVELVYSQDPSILPLVKLDPVRIKQVLLNLLSNALKFTNQGKVEITLKLQSIQLTQGILAISVRDTGIGISPDQQKNLFQAFSQADNSITRNFGGTGLGLVISNMLVQKMGSTIEFISTYGQGSEFFFNLRTEIGSLSEHPMNKYSKLSQETQDQINPSEHIILGNPMILIVEDVKINRLLIQSYLQKCVPGAQVIEAENGQVALDILVDQVPDLILMDVQMPTLDGLEATRRIRRSEIPHIRQVPIIALTAAALEGERENCLSAGMTDYLAKPVELSKLFDLLEIYLFPQAAGRLKSQG